MALVRRSNGCNVARGQLKVVLKNNLIQPVSDVLPARHSQKNGVIIIAAGVYCAYVCWKNKFERKKVRRGKALLRQSSSD